METFMRKTFQAIILLIFLIVLIGPWVCHAINVDAYTYWFKSGEKQTIEWAAVPGAAGYNIYVIRLEDGKRFMANKMVTSNTHTITWKTSGHFVYYAQPFKIVDGVAVPIGEWGNSLDPAVGIVNGKPRAWIVYVPFL